MENDDFLTKPQVYQILKVLKDQEDDDTEYEMTSSNPYGKFSNHGLSKEMIYKRVPGSKQIKVECVRELHSKGFIRIDSVKDLEKKGIIDIKTVKKGEWNSKFVTLLEPGRSLLEKLAFLKMYNPSKDRPSKAMELIEQPAEPVYELVASSYPEPTRPAVDRFAYGNRLATHMLDSLYNRLDDSETCYSRDELEQILCEIEETARLIQRHTETEFTDTFNKLYSKIAVYRSLDASSDDLAVLIKDRISKLQEELSAAQIDGLNLMKEKIGQAAEKLENETTEANDSVIKDLDCITQCFEMLFE